MNNEVHASILKLEVKIHDLASEIEKTLKLQYDENPSQFRTVPTIIGGRMKNSSYQQIRTGARSVSSNDHKISSESWDDTFDDNFDDQSWDDGPPWPGEWDDSDTLPGEKG